MIMRGLLLTLLLCACTPAHDKDPNYTYQTRQDAFFDGCKSGHDCSKPIEDPGLRNVVVKMNEMDDDQVYDAQGNPVGKVVSSAVP